MHGRCRDSTRDELVSAAQFGLVKAAARYCDSADLRARLFRAGMPVESYLHRRMHLEMIDVAREQDPLSRKDRRKVLRGEMRDPTTCSSLDELVGEGEDGVALSELLADKFDLEETVWFSERLQVLAAELPERTREVVLLRLYGLTLAEIGERFGVTESRVGRIIDRVGALFTRDREPVVRARRPEHRQRRAGASVQVRLTRRAA